MINYNTLGNGLKRGLLRFSEKISKGLTKPTQRFVTDMLYGLIASGSCKLTEIGRALKEDISLKKLVDRLGRNLAGFSEHESIKCNYLKAVRPSLGADAMLLLDASDVTKPCSKKMEAIGSVLDGSTGSFRDGYWTMGVVALSRENDQPIPVYEKLYPCQKQGGQGFRAETKAALQSLRENFDKSNTRVFDRGFDSGDVMRELVTHGESFILRKNQNRVVVHKGKTMKIDDVVRGLVCTGRLQFHSKTGNVSECKIGMTQVVLPNVNHLKLNLVICKDFGDEPLVLYTNLNESMDEIAVRVVKAYLMRWRIEEFYAFKKQGMNFEDFRVRSLNAIQTLDLLLTIAIGYIGTLCERTSEDTFILELIVASQRVQGLNSFLKKCKFYYYAIFSGIHRVIGSLRRGISHFFQPTSPVFQLSIPGF